MVSRAPLLITLSLQYFNLVTKWRKCWPPLWLGPSGSSSKVGRHSILFSESVEDINLIFKPCGLLNWLRTDHRPRQSAGYLLCGSGLFQIWDKKYYFPVASQHPERDTGDNEEAAAVSKIFAWRRIIRFHLYKINWVWEL